jgi:hypothetical protein
MGVNLLGTGFDISTHVPGVQFELGVLWRKFSDKGSQPLSANPCHALHVNTSAALAQALGRLRQGGLFLVPPEFAGLNMYDLQRKVSEVIECGLTEYPSRYTPETLQPRRYHGAVLDALCQNIRYPDLASVEERPVVQAIFDDLTRMTGRDFKAELAAGLPVLFWKRMIGYLWNIYLDEYKARRKGEKLNRALIESRLVADDLRRLVRTGCGYSDGRVLDPRIQAEVKERARGRCCHCGETDMPDSLSQVCHFKRFARGGPYLLDNLGWGHRSCDAAFDGAELIHDGHGGYWMHRRRAAAGAPDAWQRSFISPAYIDDRWAEHKALLCSGSDFRTWLTAQGYVRH